MGSQFTTGNDDGKCLASVIGNDFWNVGDSWIHLLHLPIELFPDLLQVLLRGFNLAAVPNSNVEHSGETDGGGVCKGDRRLPPVSFVLDGLPLDKMVFKVPHPSQQVRFIQIDCDVHFQPRLLPLETSSTFSMIFSAH